MKGQASTHTEIYRRFDGKLRGHPLRFRPLVSAQVRVLAKKKLPLLLLFAAPTIAGIVLSFVVYGRFSLEAELEQHGPKLGGDLKSAMIVAVAQNAAKTMLEVRNIIAMANVQIQLFALLAIGWFGAGLIAEDRKLGAHLLYFSRPMSKLDYFLGHYLTICWYGLIAALGPGLLICLVATFTSPDYSFIKEESGVVLATVINGLFTVGLLALMTLAISSLVTRKSFALVALVGLIAASEAVGGMLTGLQQDEGWMVFGFWNNMVHISDWLFDSLAGPANGSPFSWSPQLSLAICGGLAAVSALILWWRLRQLEGVG